MSHQQTSHSKVGTGGSPVRPDALPNFPGRQSVRALGLAALCLVSALLLPASAQTAPAAAVLSIQPTRVADLVLLDHGFNAGLRQGMVCRISRANTEIAEVLLVDLRPTCSAALITSVTPRQSIHAGDTASIKILKS